MTVLGQSEATIKVADVSHHYGVRPVLTHINLEVPDGGLVVVMGPNGVGKSTLLGIIAGLLAPAKGCVEINGLRLDIRSPWALCVLWRQFRLALPSGDVAAKNVPACSVTALNSPPERRPVP